MADILGIHKGVSFDASISEYEVHAHQPYSSNFGNSDEIWIRIQNKDLNLLKNTSLVNCIICHLFEDIWYEFNAVGIDRCKNVGITAVMKGWVPYTSSQQRTLYTAGFMTKEKGYSIHHPNEYFEVLIPFSMFFGFAEDYCKIIWDLILFLLISTRFSNLSGIQAKIEEVEAFFEVSMV